MKQDIIPTRVKMFRDGMVKARVDINREKLLEARFRKDNPELFTGKPVSELSANTPF